MNDTEHCEHCGTHWEETNSQTLYKIAGQWTCDECTCPSIIESR
jgi:hypothetical protein